MEFIVRPDGTITFIHDDDVAAMFPGEAVAAPRRASHVEPAGPGQWTADMGPVGGPVLGPFPRRDMALAAEVRWLRRQMATGQLDWRDDNGKANE